MRLTTALPSLILTLILVPLACNQGGTVEHVKNPSGASHSSDVTKPEDGGRYDLEFKTEAECTASQATWDAEEGECFIICQAPNSFDQTAKKCVQSAATATSTGTNTGTGTITEPEAGGRYDLEFKTEAECTANHSQWDADEAECFVICLPPDTFDQTMKMCVKASGG